MSIFREAKKLYRKVDNAVIRATTPSWRKKQKPLDPDFSGRDNVVNLRAEKDRQSYDVVIDDSGIHVGYQDKQGKTRWRKAMDVAGEVTSVDMGSPPSSKNPNRVWARTYKTSGGTFKGLDAQVKYLNDLGYNVQALDKRPAKAWRSGDVAASDKFVQDAMLKKKMTGDPDFFGPYIDPKQAHNTADREFRSGFFRNYTPVNEHRGFIFDKDVVEPHSADKPLRENKGGSWKTAGSKPKSREYYDQTRPVTTPASTIAGNILQLTGPKTEAPAAPVQTPKKMSGSKFFKLWRKGLVDDNGNPISRPPVKPTPATEPPVEAVSQGESIDLGNGVKLVKHATSAGHKSLFTGRDGRTFVAVEDSKGRKSYFYQSFAGTSGKDQGRWYPTGGLAVDKTGDAWVIKGDPVKDKAFGRPDLADLEDYLNSVLPHSDQDTDTFFQKHGYSYGDIHTKHEKAPNFNVDSFNRTGGKHDSKVLDAIVNQWKQEHLNKIWGKRGERPVNSQATSNPAKAPDSTSGTSATESKDQLLSQILGQVRSHGDKQWRNILRQNDRQGTVVRDQKFQGYQQQKQDLAVRTIGQVNEDIKSGGPVRQLTEQQIYALGTAPSPDLEKLDETPESDQELVSSLISGKAVGERDVSQHLLGKTPEKIGNKAAYSDLPLPFTEQHETGFTKEGDIPLAGYQALAEAFQDIDPKIAEKFRKTAENLKLQKDLGQETRNTKSGKEKLRIQYQKEQLQNELLNTGDPLAVQATLNRPVGDGVEPILYPHQGKARLSDEDLAQYAQLSGQGKTAIKNIHVPGGKNETVWSPVEDLAESPRERLQRARTIEQQVNPVASMERDVEDILRQQKPDLTPEDLTEYENLPRTLEMPQQQETYNPAEDLAHQVATRMGGLAALNEARTMLGSGVSPSESGVDDRSGKAIPYTRKNAEQRLFNLENNSEQAQSDVYRKYFESILANPPEELVNLDPNASPEENAAAVRQIAERVLQDNLVRHMTDYTGNVAEDPNGLPNIFRSTVERDSGLRKKFNIPADVAQRPSQALIREIAAPQEEGVSLLDQIDNLLMPGRHEGDMNLAHNKIVGDARQMFRDREQEVFDSFMGERYGTAGQPESIRPDERTAEIATEQPAQTMEATSGQLPTYDEIAGILPENVSVAPEQVVAPVPTRTGLRRKSSASDQPAKAAADQVAEQVQGGTGFVGKSGSGSKAKATKPAGTPMNNSVSVSSSVKLAKDYAAANPDYNGDHTKWRETKKYPLKKWDDFDPNDPASDIGFTNYEAAVYDAETYAHPDYEDLHLTPIEAAVNSYAQNAADAALNMGLGVKVADEAAGIVHWLAKHNKVLRDSR